MLTADQLDVLASGYILELYEEFQQSVIISIVKGLIKLGSPSATAIWQMRRMIEAGVVYEDTLKKISVLTGKSENELKNIFSKAGVKSMKFDDSIYIKAGMKPIPLNQSAAMLDVMKAGLERTASTLRNLTLTTAITGQNAFIRAADLAYMQVATGAFDYNTAIRQAIKEVSEQGITVINYASGRQDQLDVAVRRTVLTGVNQTAGQLTEKRADEMGSDLVAVSAHLGARNKGIGPMNHESWQGKVYSRSGTHPKYPNFYEITGYGTGEGLGGWNCRHSHYPWFEGISKQAYSEADLKSYANKTVTYNGKKMSYYDATQKQRYFERQIRNTKREASAVEAAGLDNSAEKEAVRKWQARMRDFIEHTGLYRQRIREQL